MKEENKIFNFNDYNKKNNIRRHTNRYNLVCTIVIEVFEQYKFNYIYSDGFSKSEILKILNKIYLKTSKSTPEPKFEFQDILNVRRFTIYYLEDKKNPEKFKFICTNPAITDWKLYVILSIING